MGPIGRRGTGGVTCWVICLLAVGAMVQPSWGMTEAQPCRKGPDFRIKQYTWYGDGSGSDVFPVNISCNQPIVVCEPNIRQPWQVIIPEVIKGSVITVTAFSEMTCKVDTPIGKMDWDNWEEADWVAPGNPKCDKNHRGTSWTIVADEDFLIGTKVPGGLSLLYPVKVIPGSMLTPTVTPTHLFPIVDTCTHLAQATTETKIYWTIYFPPIPKCARRKRAWYDTLLGGTGTVLGFANAADNEVTRTMLSNTGEHSARALHQVGVWLPTALVGQKENAALWKTVFNWEINLWGEAQNVLWNLTKQSNWTVCSIQTLHAAAQKESFLRVVTSGNFREWRKVWNITDSLWLKLHPEHTECDDDKCTGYWTQYKVTTTKTVCKYQVLPVITQDSYWFLHMDGDWFEPKTNMTFNSRFCDMTDQGLACRLQHAYSNPCLTDSEAVLCDWTREPIREMMWQVGPHTLCVATTQNNSQVPSVPFVGCLGNVHLWHWRNMTYRLTNYTESRRLTTVQWEVLHSPWKVSLERFKCALESSTDIQKLIKSHASRISSLMVSTMVVKGKVVHAAKIVQQASAHHWWDIFSGMSSTARTVFVPPLIIVLIAICVLTLCNVGSCFYVRGIRKELNKKIKQVSYY